MKFKTELQMQAHITQWFHNEFPGERQMLHANDNNSFNSIEGAKKKALGVRAGVSDLEYVDWNGKTWWIELKLPGEVQLPEQIAFQNKITERGHEYIILYSFEEFKSFISKRLYYGTLGDNR